MTSDEQIWFVTAIVVIVAVAWGLFIIRVLGQERDVRVLMCEFGCDREALFHVMFAVRCCGVDEARLCSACMLESLPRKQGGATDITSVTYEGREINLDQVRAIAMKRGEG